MKNLNLLLSSLVVALLTASCVAINGELEVLQPMTANKKSGFLHLQRSEVTLQPNTYKAEFKFNGKKSLLVKIKDSVSMTIPLKGSSDLKVESNGTGPFKISHSQINQSFDVNGHIATDVDVSAKVDYNYDCTYIQHSQICNQKECTDVDTTVSGTDYVTSHNETVKRTLNIDFVKIDQQDVLAKFNGESSETYTIIDYDSGCH